MALETRQSYLTQQSSDVYNEKCLTEVEREGRVKLKCVGSGVDRVKRLSYELIFVPLPKPLLLTVSFQLYPCYNVSCKPLKLMTVTLEPFARQNRSERFLLIYENGNGFRLSFTGRQEEQGTSTYH